MRFKQKTVQFAPVILSRNSIYRSLCILCIGLGFRTSATEAQTMAHKPGDQVATLRLIAASGQTFRSASGSASGSFDVGVEIAMPPGSHTYWKQPGEAGVPPVFAFNGSVNVAKAEVRFPVPSRLSEDGLDAFGYTGTVVFPVVVTPTDRSKPATLKVDVAYAVCNKICIPAHGTAQLQLPAEGGEVDGEAVTTALALVPLPATEAEHDSLKVNELERTAKQSWQVAWTGTRPLEDLFVVMPEGFYFSTRKTGPNMFVLTAEQVVVSGAEAKVPVTLVLKRVGGSLSTTETLDVRAASR